VLDEVVRLAEKMEVFLKEEGDARKAELNFCKDELINKLKVADAKQRDERRCRMVISFRNTT
jgi:hypothetical protein